MIMMMKNCFLLDWGLLNDLKVEINNKANNFDIFSLYKLDDFNLTYY